jgi:hypothetical protein
MIDPALVKGRVAAQARVRLVDIATIIALAAGAHVHCSAAWEQRNQKQCHNGGRSLR